jgi:hypothetical protein
MFQNYKFKKEITKQELNTLSKYTDDITNKSPIGERMSAYINTIENLTLDILTRSGILCSSNLPLRHYSTNPTRVMIKCSADIIALVGKLRMELQSNSLLNELEDLFRKIISKATYIASINKFQVSSHGICIISNAGVAISLLSRLRLDQISLKPSSTPLTTEDLNTVSTIVDDTEPVSTINN